MPVPARLSLVTLGVADLERSTAFYRALGWEASSASVPGVVTFFATDGGQLAVFGRADLAADAGLDPEDALAGTDTGLTPVALAINCDAAGDVDAAVRTWAEVGGTVVRPPRDAAEFEGRQAYVADPDGHLWEIAWNPGFPIGSDGRPTLP